MRSSDEILSRIVDTAMERLREYHLTSLNQINEIATTSIAAMLSRRHFKPSVLDRLFDSTLDKLIEAIERTDDRKYATGPEVNPPAIEGYRLRLSRVIKDAIGLPDIVDNAYDGTEPTRSRRVLIGVFLLERHKKIPPGKEMAEIQALYIERVLDGL